MTARLTTLWEGVRMSLWFLPGTLTLCAVLLAWFALSFPLELVERGGPAWLLSRGSFSDASHLLSSLLTSMITMATLAISITMVVLALAAGQLGPRLIRSFMGDTRAQLALGFLLATIVYLLLVLHMVSGGTREESLPRLAVTVGTLLVLICVFVLLFFVHHLARSIVADTVIQRVGRDLDAAVGQMLPQPRDACQLAAQHRHPPPLDGGAVLSLPGGGYVQAVDYAGLAECAREAGAVIELGFRPGQHLLPHGEHGRVAPASALTQDMRETISGRIVVGSTRTASQDLEFAIRQLVEVAVRALSPGINDPFTAIAAIDRLGVSLVHVMRHGAADGAWCDREGMVRVTGKTTSFRGIVDAAFNQIRQAGAGHPAVLIRILATLARLAEHVRHEEHRNALTDHVAMVFAAGSRAIEEPRDIEAMETRRSRALARLAHR